MTTELRTLRPGLLVSLSTSIRGNISYRTEQLEGRHLDASGQERARWETTRVITDPDEHERATKVRSKVRSLIRSVCAESAFGLLCPEDDADKLAERIAEARKLADEFNAEASLTRISVNVISGRIAQDDVEAARAIAGEVRALMEDMQDGLKRLDVEAVRNAANKARSVGEMLTPEAKGRLEIAIEAARKSARQIVKAGETVGLEIDRAAIAKIDLARTSFLDIEIEAGEVGQPQMQGRALDLEVV